MKIIISYIIISCGCIYGQFFGVGIELNDIMPTDSDNISSILFPITIGSFLRIEPEIQLNRESTKIAEDDGLDGTSVDYTQQFSLGLLVFLSYEEEENNFYIGVRGGYGMYGITYEGAFDEADNEYTAFAITPAIGGELFIKEKFSLGGEILFPYITMEQELDDITNITLSTMYTGSRAFLRFYL